VVRRAMEGSCDAIIIGVPAESPHGHALRLADWVEHVVRNGHCRVFLVRPPAVPQTPVAD